MMLWELIALKGYKFRPSLPESPFLLLQNFPHPLHVFLVSFAKTASSGNLILFPSQIAVPLLKTLAHGQFMPTLLSIWA